MAEDEWVPLRQAVIEVSAIYAEAMQCDRREAIDDALESVLRRAEFMLADTRASKWILNFPEDKHGKAWRRDHYDTPSIPSEFWAVYKRAECVVTDDWVVGEFAFSFDGTEEVPGGFGMAVGVEITRRGLPLIGENAAMSSGACAAFGKLQERLEERRGARRKWDWEGALCSIIVEANSNPDGLPEGFGAQAEIGRRLAEWFRNNQNGEPVPSEIGARSARIVQTIDRHRK